VVIKPYDIVWRNVEFSYGSPGEDNIIELSEDNAKRDPHSYLIVVCFAFDIVAADSGIFRKRIDRGHIGIINASPDETVFPPRRGDPVRLLKRNVFWTEVGAD